MAINERMTRGPPNEDEYWTLYRVSYCDVYKEFEPTTGTRHAKQLTVEQPEIAWQNLILLSR